MSREKRIPIQTFALGMRLEPTKQELLLYNALLVAFRPYVATVRAQEPIGPYIADFYIGPCNFVIEVDGESHVSEKAKAHDKKRDIYMKTKGLAVMRFKNNQIDRSAKACAEFILSKALPLPQRKDKPTVTHCPPSWTIKKESRKARRLIFWRG